MKVEIDILGDNSAPMYDKDTDRPGVTVSEDNVVIQVGNTVTDSGLPTQRTESRMLVPLAPVTICRMESIASAMKYAEIYMGYESGCLVVRGDDVGFFSVG